jgi:hypothetical protein
MKSRERTTNDDEVQRKNCGEREKTLTLISTFVYHVMNSTCIDMKTIGPNIYMYMKEKYTKNPLKKYNNEGKLQCLPVIRQLQFANCTSLLYQIRFTKIKNAECRL